MTLLCRVPPCSQFRWDQHFVRKLCTLVTFQYRYFRCRSHRIPLWRASSPSVFCCRCRWLSPRVEDPAGPR